MVDGRLDCGGQLVQNDFGSALKEWRSRRNVSQLDLGLAANVSARHISFLETGRSRPSRSMVLHLCDHLNVPRGSRNGLLSAAGFSNAYRMRALDDDDMKHVKAAVDWTLDRHEPFPAMALDRHWTLVRANRPAAGLLGTVGVSAGDRLLDAFDRTKPMGAAIENWEEVAQHVIVRLRTESAHYGGDPVLDAAADRMANQLGHELPAADNQLPAVAPARYRAGEVTLSFFTTIAQFGTAEDIALADLRIELMFPADDETRQMMLS